MNGAFMVIYDSRDDTVAGKMAHQCLIDGQFAPRGGRKSGRKMTHCGRSESANDAHFERLQNDVGKRCRSVTARCNCLAQDRADIQFATLVCAKALASTTVEGPRRTETPGVIFTAPATPGD